MTVQDENPLRSMLFVPGNHPRRLAKAFDCGADAVIVDLEDSVQDADKARARCAAAAVIVERRPVAAFVRINAMSGETWRDDLREIVRPGLGGVVQPKAESARDLLEIDLLIGQLELERGMRPGEVELLPLVESARGVEALGELAAASPRTRRISFGIADYTLDLGLQPSADEQELDYIRARLTHASRSAGLQPPIDSVVVEVRDPARFRASALRGRRFGMVGKLCIHPDQVVLANEIFSPSEDEIARAHAIVSACRVAGRSGRGAGSGRRIRRCAGPRARPSRAGRSLPRQRSSPAVMRAVRGG